MRKRIFLICKVRNVPPETEKKHAAYVASKEKEGYEVYWPKRDTDQNDHLGLRICKDNRLAIVMADEVHVWYDKTSEGSKFDLGMVLMMLYFSEQRYQKIVIANPEEVQPTPKKSLENVLIALANNYR